MVLFSRNEKLGWTSGRAVASEVSRHKKSIQVRLTICEHPI